LALAYFVLIVALQSAFTTITEQQQNAFVTVLSTLVIAVLFFPLRRRVQEFIDRRFFRRKYDAVKTLVDFAATARDETDLDKLTARLVVVENDAAESACGEKPDDSRPPHATVGGDRDISDSFIKLRRHHRRRRPNGLAAAIAPARAGQKSWCAKQLALRRHTLGGTDLARFCARCLLGGASAWVGLALFSLTPLKRIWIGMDSSAPPAGAPFRRWHSRSAGSFY
jgi:hypothetical protein